MDDIIIRHHGYFLFSNRSGHDHIDAGERSQRLLFSCGELRSTKSIRVCGYCGFYATFYFRSQEDKLSQLRSTYSQTLFYYHIFSGAAKHCANHSSTACYSDYLRSRICPGDTYAENHHLVHSILLYGFRSQYMDPGRTEAEDAMENQFIWGSFECDSQLYPDTAYRYQRSSNCFGSSTAFRQFCAVFYDSFPASRWTSDY